MQILDISDIAVSVEHATYLNEVIHDSRDSLGLSMVSIQQNRTKSCIPKIQ